MAGNTRKMTREALEARGPRMVLGLAGGRPFLFKEDRPPYLPTAKYPVFHLTMSFTRSYLMRIAKLYK